VGASTLGVGVGLDSGVPSSTGGSGNKVGVGSVAVDVPHATRAMASNNTEANLNTRFLLWDHAGYVVPMNNVFEVIEAAL